MKWTVVATMLAVGCEGAAGPQGEAGASGTTGTQGDEGEQGEKGEMGTPGTIDPTSCTMVVDTDLGGALATCDDNYFLLYGGCDAYNGNFDVDGRLLVNTPKTISPSTVPNGWECLTDGDETVHGSAFCCPMP